MTDDIKGFSDIDSSIIQTDQSNIDILCECLRIKANSNRKLTMYTYGEKKSVKPSDVQREFDVRDLIANKIGLDLNNQTGLDYPVQKSIESTKFFQGLLMDIVKTVEDEDLTVIGIYCFAGKHRSVSCAELIKTNIYPNSTTIHLELKKMYNEKIEVLLRRNKDKIWRSINGGSSSYTITFNSMDALIINGKQIEYLFDNKELIHKIEQIRVKSRYLGQFLESLIESDL